MGSSPSSVPAIDPHPASGPDPVPVPDPVPGPASQLAPAIEKTLDGEFQNLELGENGKEKENDNSDENEKGKDNDKVDFVVKEENDNSDENEKGKDNGKVDFVVKEENDNSDENEKGKDNGKVDFVVKEENDNSDENEKGKDNGKADFVVKEEKIRRSQHPQRPDAEDCSYYRRTGTCKFGLNCKFNHPVRRKNQAVKEKEREKEEALESGGQQVCKYYLSTGGCKFGKACRYTHPRQRHVVDPPLEHNFLGLPIRPGERECPFYMRTGSCKYASECRFNHPDPTIVGGCEPSSEYHNVGLGSVPFHSTGISQPAVASCSPQGTLDETVPYMDISSSYVSLMPSPPQGVHPNPEWNGYQDPVYPPEISMHPPSALVMNNSMKKADASTHHQQQMLAEEFQERPGQPECGYSIRNGDRRFRSGQKFHHSKSRVSKSPVCALSDKGLPLRPDQNICTHYNRFGICKFGPTCKYDHPISYGFTSSPVVPTPDQPTCYDNSETLEEARMAGWGNGSEDLMQKFV